MPPKNRFRTWDPMKGQWMELEGDEPSPQHASSASYMPPLWDHKRGIPDLLRTSQPASGYVTGFQMPATGSSAHTMMSVSPYNNFSHYLQDQILVRDLLSRPLAYVSKFIPTGNGTQHPIDVVKQCANAVGKIFYQDRFISTAVLIAQNTIITARHSVNGCQLGRLRFLDSKFGDFYSLELLEDGAFIEEDYIIFRIVLITNPSFKTHINPLKINNEHPVNSEWLLCLGYVQDGMSHSQCVTMGQCNSMEPDAPLNLVTYVATQCGFSGAPYINSKGQIVGIHLKTTHELLFENQRTGLLFANLINLTEEPDAFSSYILTQLSQNLGFNINATAIAVLKHSETAGKARYDGQKDNTNESRYRDHADWEVYVEITNEVSDWKRLNIKDPRLGKTNQAAIQMGHIFSVAEYWNKGNKIPGHKYQHPAKNKWTGAINKTTFKSQVARPFMSDASNYEFQWGPLNEQRGSPENYDAPTGYQWFKNAKGYDELT